MKFKKLLFVTTSTVVAGSSLIALAAACHNKNQKNPGNNKQTNLQNKNNQTSQKQELNPELSKKQTNKSNQKEKNQNSTLSPTIKQPETSESQKKQLPQKNYQENENKNSDQKSQQSSKKQKDEKLTPTPKVQQEQKKTEQKEQENTNTNSTQQNEQNSNALPNQQKEPELKQKDQSTETPENDKNKLKVQEKSDVNFIDNNPIIDQEVDYTSYIKLKIDDKYLNNTNKIFEATLTSSENNKQIIGRGVYYSDPQYQNNPKNVIPFEFSGIDYNKTYSLKSVTFSDYSSEWKQINSKTVDLKLSKNVESTKIVVKKIKHKIQLNDEEKQKIPVTVTAKITEKNSKYNIELDFNPNDKKDEINQKYATIVITYSGYTGLSTISGFERKDYKIENNKINITIDPELIKNYKEIQLQIQRITDEQNSHINSKTFILNFENSNAEFDRNKNQFFKFKEVDLTKINNN